MRVTRSDMGRVLRRCACLDPRACVLAQALETSLVCPHALGSCNIPLSPLPAGHPSVLHPKRRVCANSPLALRVGCDSGCASAATRARSSRAVSLPPPSFPPLPGPAACPAAGRLHAPLLPSLGPAACPAAAPSLASPPRLASGCRPQAGCRGTACTRPSSASVVTWPPRRPAPAPPPWPPPPSPWWRPRPPCQPPRRRTRPRSRPPRPPPPRSSFMARARPGAGRRASAGCPRRWPSSPPSPTWWRGGSACRPPCSRR